jgi:hypothetical membrane protein
LVRISRAQLKAQSPLILGLATAVTYSCFAAIAAIQFPRGYGPWDSDTLSQLGNRNLNPGGYAIYLVGCGLAGLFSTAFFISLGAWSASGSRLQNRVLLLLQALGVTGSVGLFMNAIFPENQYSQHHFWAGVLFNTLAAAALVSIPALWRSGGPNAVLVAFDGLAFIAVAVMFAFPSKHWLEWPPAGAFLLFPTVLGLLTRRLPG